MRLQAYETSRSAHHDALSKIKAIEDKNQQADELIFNQGVYADLKPQLLAVFVHGLEGNLPTQVHTARSGSRKIDEDFYHNPFFALFSTPDYGYIVNIVVSLLALLFVFDAICGEKERGTLKVMLANAVPRDLTIFSKWIGGYLCLVVPFLVALLAGIAYIQLSGTVTLDAQSLERLVWLIGVSLLYISLSLPSGFLFPLSPTAPPPPSSFRSSCGYAPFW